MAQVRIENDVYNKLKEAAEFNKRTVGQHIAFLLDNEITFNEIRGMLVGKALSTPVAQVAPAPSTNDWERPTDRGHTVTVASVDTSQPGESITPHKRWVPTTPEELEAELEKVRRGEREA